MKFGRYLEENATPEWKRAYIDYRGAKKAIKRAAASLENEENEATEEIDNFSSDDEDHGPSARPRKGSTAGGSALSRIITGAGSPGKSSPRTTGTSRSKTPRTAPISPLSPRPGSQTGGVGFPRSPGGSRRPSPGYGSTGTSPPLEDSTTLPPLDLGEPTIPSSPDLKPGQSSSSSAFPEPGDINKQRLKGKVDSARGSGFSPGITSIPEVTVQEGDSGSAEPRSSDGTSPPSPDTPTTPLTHDSRKQGKDSPRLKGSPGKFSFKTPKTHASVGVSPGGVADAPSGKKSLRSMKLPSPKIQPKQPQTFEELYDTLNPEEQAFFDHLDKQLDKVETFYSAREKEATRRYSELKDQCNALAEHRRIFHEQFPGGQPEWEAKVEIYSKKGRVPILAKAVKQLHARVPFHSHSTDDEGQNGTNGNGHGANGAAARRRTGNATPAGQNLQVPSGSGSAAYSSAVSPAGGSTRRAPSPAGSDAGASSGSGGDAKTSGAPSRDGSRLLPGQPRQFDPERYQKYKKELRAAVLEFYRQLELIKNYRILNLTGFRKALKKFEKVTGVRCLDLYTDDKIAPCSFSRGEPIDQLLKQTEELFTEHFEHGDVKKARQRLRGQDSSSTHYQTVFRSGTYIGLGLPAAVLAIVQSFQPSVRQEMPQWNALLQMYGALYIPVLFGILFELNLDAWVEARINYEFVMELERPVLDYRSYLEIPAFMFLTLSYCFFFSFYFIHLHTVAPTTWPLAWLVFAVVFFINPLPIFRRRSRYWLLRVLFRVLTPGISRVEFIAFFMADELNSLTYSIQNLMFMGCSYGKHWPANVSAVCPMGSTWPYALLASAAPVSRLIQCLKRYYDSGLYIHLINAGKYGSTILTAWLYMFWRHRHSSETDFSFALWVVFAALNSIYTSTWDLVVDWSLLRPGYKLLRPELAYGWPGFYYFSMVTNVLLRFIWVWYIPKMTRLGKMRSWLFALLEMLRRWQWNFYRLEAEHQGNADSYRATRDIPLPYRQTENDSDDDEYIFPARNSGFAKRFRDKVLGGDAAGRVKDTLNVGPMGHVRQREYEAQSVPAPGSDSSDPV